MYYEHLETLSNGHFSFDITVQSVPRESILKIPRERAAQCACAGTYSVRIAPTQRAQRIFENDHYSGRHMTASTGKGLIPFLSTVYPDDHRFMQDNNPKHTSRYAKAWYEENDVRWKTPASSPDLNPIELIWHALKDYLRIEYKPRNLTQLTQGIKAFWRTFIPAVCSKFVGH